MTRSESPHPDLGCDFWEHAPLLLTATIRVARGLADAPLNDASRRENDYLTSLRFYLSQQRVKHVVFVENSGADLGRFEQLAVPTGKRLELISLATNEFPPEFGKGFGEASLMDHAFAESRLLQGSAAFVKVTGRLLLRNVDELLASVEPTCSGYFDVRDHQLYARLGIAATAQHADTRFFAMRRELFDAHFRRLHLNHDGGTFSIEASYLRAIRAARAEGWRLQDRFAVEPLYSGIAGHGKNYDSVSERAKRVIRGATRRWLPSLKI